MSSYDDREALQPVAEPYAKPDLPTYPKRTCRLAIGSLSRQDMWRDGARPQAMLRLIDEAAAISPDLLLLSEQGCDSNDPTTRRTMDLITEKAAQLQSYIAVSGIGVDKVKSVLHVWDRQGALVYTQPIYWSGKAGELDVFDCWARAEANEGAGSLDPQQLRQPQPDGADADETLRANGSPWICTLYKRYSP